MRDRTPTRVEPTHVARGHAASLDQLRDRQTGMLGRDVEAMLDEGGIVRRCRVFEGEELGEFEHREPTKILPSKNRNGTRLCRLRWSCHLALPLWWLL